jgi:hypothetical protein
MIPFVTKGAVNEPHPQLQRAQPLDCGLAALSLIAAYYHIAAHPAQPDA